MGRLLLRTLCGCGALAISVVSSEATAEPAVDAAATHPTSTPTPTPVRRASATTVSVVPGVLVHGAGSWLLDDSETAWDALALEGAGVGLFLAGGSTIVFSGAARSLIGPAIATTTLGAGLFVTSWLLDVFHVSTPEQVRGRERGVRDETRSHLELVLLQSPQFYYGPMLRHGVNATSGSVRLGYEAAHAPLGRFDHVRLEVTYLPWQANAARSGNRLELGAASISYNRLDEDFRTRGFELSARLRLDSRSLARRAKGAFSEVQVGVVGQRTEWLATNEAPSASFDETLLIARTAFGVYLGDPWRRGGELQIYYDQRHDGLAEGMLARGLGSGALGHAGLAGEYFLTQNVGVRASTEVGSAWVCALGLSFRSSE